MDNARTEQSAQREEVERNSRAFRKLLPDFLGEHRNKFALMRDVGIVDFFDTSRDAFVAGSNLYEDGRCFVQEVTDQLSDLGYLSHADALRPLRAQHGPGPRGRHPAGTRLIESRRPPYAHRPAGHPLGTLAASGDLKAADMDRRQAEATATSLGTAISAGHSGLATRIDLAKLETKQSTVAVALAQTALVSGLLKPVH